MNTIFQKKALMKALPLIMLGLAVASCQESFEIHVKQSGDVTDFSFFEDRIFKRSRITPCIQALRVYRMEEARARKVWGINPQRGGCVNVDNVRMGTVPQGFVLFGEALSPLPAGRYRVEVEDDAHRNGAGEFTIPAHAPRG